MTIPPPGPLAYQGQVVVPFIDRTFAPTSSNNDFMVPTLWINTSSKNAYLLTAKPLGVANWLNLGNSSSAPLVTLTGDSGGALTGDSNQNINILGTAGQIVVTGSAHTLTLSLAGGGTAIDSFIPDSGTSPVAPAADGSVTMSGSGSITTVGGTNTLTTQLTGLTNHAVLVGAGTTTITKVGPSATTGAPLISGGAAADPGFSTTFTIVDSTGITTLSKSASGSTNEIVTTNTSNTASSGAASIASVAGTSAGDAYNQWSVGSTISYALGTDTPTTRQPLKLNYALASSVTPSTGTNLLAIDYLGSAAADPTFTFSGGILKLTSASTSTVTSINAQNTNGSEFSAIIADAKATKTGFFSSGQYDTPLYWNFGMASTLSNAFALNIGTAPLAPEGGTIRWRVSQTGAVTFNEAFTFPTTDGTAGQVLTTNGAGTVTWASSGSGGWSVIGASQTLAVNQGYFCTTGAALSLALPAVSAVGDTIEVVLDGSTSWTITQPNAATRIRIGNNQTTLGVGGSLASTLAGDSVKLVCETANARWAVISMIGSITVV